MYVCMCVVLFVLLCVHAVCVCRFIDWRGVEIYTHTLHRKPKWIWSFHRLIVLRILNARDHDVLHCFRMCAKFVLLFCGTNFSQRCSNSFSNHACGWVARNRTLFHSVTNPHFANSNSRKENEWKTDCSAQIRRKTRHFHDFSWSKTTINAFDFDFELLLFQRVFRVIIYRKPWKWRLGWFVCICLCVCVCALFVFVGCQSLASVTMTGTSKQRRMSGVCSCVRSNRKTETETGDANRVRVRVRMLVNMRVYAVFVSARHWVSRNTIVRVWWCVHNQKYRQK